MRKSKEEIIADAENKILEACGNANGLNGFTVKMWDEKYGKKFLCQVVNGILKNMIRRLKP